MSIETITPREQELLAINKELLEAVKAVLSNKRGPDSWLVLAVQLMLAVHCVTLEEAIARATKGEAK